MLNTAILSRPIYMDVRPLILGCFLLIVFFFFNGSTNDFPMPKKQTVPVIDTVLIQIPADSLTCYVLAQIQAIESKMKSTSVTADDNPFEVATFEVVRREGYVPTPYRCPAGLLTVGFGDVIDTDFERRLCLSGGFTFSTARAKLYANLKTGGDEVERRFPGKYKTARQWLALSLLGLSIGWERLERKYPAFYAEIAAGKPSARWLKYCKYRDGRTGAVRRSTNLERTRRVEWMLFNGDYQSLKPFTNEAARIARVQWDRGRLVSLQKLQRE